MYGIRVSVVIRFISLLTRVRIRDKYKFGLRVEVKETDAEQLSYRGMCRKISH